ncbi:HNH endonuclease signature motif containing protein, partial [Arthrobacter sp. EPSL27]|uniref:HNH endonuclease signature motif containing protein n=1 Tax=Arthrobacter sp. EPSL27 TaxID=1745378 RepID=UPI00074817EF
METVKDFITVEDSGRDNVPAGDSGAERVVGADGRDRPGRLSTAEALDAALALLQDVGPSAAGDSALWDFRESADFTGKVEELSRFVEHLQVVGAGAVDRSRKHAAAVAAKASTSWTTGWRDDTGNATTPATPDAASEGVTGWRDDIGDATTPATTDAASEGVAGWRDDTGTATTPATTDAASGAAADWRDDSSYGTPLAGLARDAVAAGASGATAAASVAAAEAAAVVDDGYRNTTEFLRGRLRISAAEARRRLALSGELLPRWGFTGEVLPAVRGELGAAVASGEVGSRSATIITLALDRVRHTCAPEAADRMEYALTRVAVENDPDFLARVARKWVDALDQDGAEPSEELLRQVQGAFIRKPRHGLHHLEIFATTEQFEQLVTVMNTGTNPRATGTGADAADGGAGDGVPFDLRTQPQKRLDGLVGASKVALAAGGLPATGGLRPQVMVTIDYRDLLARLDSLGNTGNTGNMLFTGPVTASTVRKIACDADIIPVLLGGNGRILDIGRTSRVFPPHIRKALTARDLGCAFPACTIPATWCEAHHITYWSRGGTTGTDNGVMLCSRHHHLIHKEQ